MSTPLTLELATFLDEQRERAAELSEMLRLIDSTETCSYWLDLALHAIDHISETLDLPPETLLDDLNGRLFKLQKLAAGISDVIDLSLDKGRLAASNEYARTLNAMARMADRLDEAIQFAWRGKPALVDAIPSLETEAPAL